LSARAAVTDLDPLALTRADGAPGTVGDVLADSFTDALVVLHEGELAAEWYSTQGAADRPHLLMSVTKSVVGCVAAALIGSRNLDPDDEITSYLPELAGSGYAGATVRHVIDMRSGVAFSEDYADPDSDVRRLDRWVGWRSQGSQSQPQGLYGFLATLIADRPHGGEFRYRSAETDVLGWVCERASGTRMADLVSSLIWEPMGAEQDGDFICDAVGTAVHDGGLCVTARDLARFGQLLLDGGTVPRADTSGEEGTHHVVPPGWLREAWAADSDVRAAFSASPAEQPLPGGWYRNQFWFRPGRYGDVLVCLGIYGQMLHVNRTTRTVCVKFSSWPSAQQPALLEDTLRAFDAVGGALADREPTGPRGLPGVASGLRRRGGVL
jgi:CubicO group peptidase (beta-lactamase class C family)